MVVEAAVKRNSTYSPATGVRGMFENHSHENIKGRMIGGWGVPKSGEEIFHPQLPTRPAYSR